MNAFVVTLAVTWVVLAGCVVVLIRALRIANRTNQRLLAMQTMQTSPASAAGGQIVPDAYLDAHDEAIDRWFPRP